MKSVEVPDVKLVMEGTAEAHAHKVTSEQGQYDVWIKVEHFKCYLFTWAYSLFYILNNNNINKF